MRDPVEAYFTELRDIRASGAGVAETSYYGALQQLLNEIGGHLKPKVRAVSQLKNLGAGAPDFGLFTHQQFKHAHDAEPIAGQVPARGAIEVKGTSDDVFDWSKWPDPDQVPRYVERYGLVLVTNLRDFVLVGRGPGGEARLMESCRLATTEAGFWASAQQPRKFTDAAAEGLTEFLQRVMLQNAPLVEPKDVAWFLASYARTARLRLEHRDLPALASLREQLEEALGLKFEGEKGDNFFRSTLVQTLFYGMFASWVLWTREQATTEAGKRGRFEWETASATLHVPMVSELFYQFSNPAKLGPLGIAEVLEWAEEVLNRVDRVEFFSRFKEDHAVQYFYEPFLEAFDPQLRKELGVWYTPDEVVKYMVARVDWALRKELHIADGLADPSVYVLDPCCGTGAYLVEVLRKIDETLTAKGADALTRQDVKRAAMERVIGFEIMPAPFVVAHLQLGLLLAELGVPLSDTAEERAAIYLTNALTGWRTDGEQAVTGKAGKRPHPAQLLLEFEEERDAATRVKQKAPILVVLGNPPYNGFAGVAADEEAELVEPYRAGLRDWGITKNYLGDLYVRFFGLAEQRVLSGPRGVACFISNESWVSDPSYVSMRQRLMMRFDEFWIDNMHGDRTISERGPDGRTSQTIFAIPGHSAGIRQGTAISLWVRRSEERARPEGGEVFFRDDFDDSSASDRRGRLIESLGDSDPRVHYVRAAPSKVNRYSFRPERIADDYRGWPSLTDIVSEKPYLGMNENRGESLSDVDREALVARMKSYFDAGVPTELLPAELAGLKKEWANFNPHETRARLLRESSFSEDKVRPFLHRPFDLRWAYAEPTANLWNRPRPPFVSQQEVGSSFLFARYRSPKSDGSALFLFGRSLADQHVMFVDGYAVPLDLRQPHSDNTLFEPNGPRPNLSGATLDYLQHLGCSLDEAQMVFMNILAVGCSPQYIEESADALLQDWPRVPLPASANALQASGELGSRVAALVDPGRPLAQQTSSLTCFGVLSATADNPLDPTKDLSVTARWGQAGKGGVVTPSIGKLTERDYAAGERAAIAEGAESLGMSAEQAIGLLGETCFDVYLNDVAYWRCVPATVWRYTIGGYQVIKKWLSYRERALLGRDLKPEEARYVSEMVRRIAALVLMQPELDANYERVKADVWEWGKGSSG